ncbi:hypothetical protein BV22DRAFT_1000537 [Leucogyrophana mollusca]|uniref:Uncharacterized protein n=1 Tax=Leucogyrophana mollusca TaxID=85980 RepID=A0ACB8BYK9_9AGAM|nr:hypothetical protein BV22DRAFT_1000537 [Leucogyrophana mollusca]
MSFQHFRLGQLAMSQPLPPHLQQNQQQLYPQNTPPSAIPSSSILPPSATNQAPSPPKPSSSRPPYGSGDTDDGYTLLFPSLAAFQEWRNHEEETQMVEFVKGDTHGSKAVPPRFKDHTKLVCARHSRSGRKKYVKKHPERVRKVPSRKLEGQGCQASISYKTYFDTEEVRVCYIAEHSHAIGLANLPFTRRGRRATVQQEKEKSKRHSQAPPSTGGDGSTTPKGSQAPTPGPVPQQQQMQSYNLPIAQLPHPFPPYQGPPPGASPYQHMVPPPPGPPVQQEQWDRMSVLFNSIREHARAYDYPGPSVVALESVLIRLYLESPMGGGGPGMGLGQLGVNMHGGGVPLPHGQQVQGQMPQGHAQDLHSHSPMNGTSANGEQATSEMDSGMESG